MSLLKLSGFTYSRSLAYFIIFTITFSIFSFIQQSFVFGGRLRLKSPEEIIVFGEGLLKLGMDIHMWSVLPAGTLLPLQFLPIVRRKYMNLHRYAGRALFIMLIIGNTCAFGIGHVSFGGTLETRIWIYTLGVLEYFALFKSWIAIRRKKIEEHRIWAIRTWGWAGSILTMRLLMIPFMNIVLSPYTRTFYSLTTCSALHNLYTAHSYPLTNITQTYPMCENIISGVGDYQDIHIPIELGLFPPERLVASLNMVFGTAGWCSLVLHLLGVEAWLQWSGGAEGRKRVGKAKIK
ncbi:hypothetical protein SS1G_01261 [Sclerotinia sclerotiorum 1980 UF-70]|uniref:Uncharacterized protein n=2 Tax=Sclerotinia sclerotiorum (strain ATCC 18683 / 1980 / Ss-1) TaxID=665079 RepID=A0A1D9PU77_SCLS1|nr:hypothetical protein SS1G_01261 [Sclerotinia sclerotiorum 1980 UF-70]APA06247.1 hypothetical protein sscle_01g010170 [Sclerotinia sclerotiorum 1980 UF-70]EDN96335.1 hypothetical protein SS1G_01261 [Sclerotinia sclerotiorum 1980 UF-70]